MFFTIDKDLDDETQKMKIAEINNSHFYMQEMRNHQIEEDMKHIRYMCQLFYFGPCILGEEDVIMEKRDKVKGTNDWQVTETKVIDRIPSMVLPDMSDPVKKTKHDFIISVCARFREMGKFGGYFDANTMLSVYNDNRA